MAVGAETIQNAVSAAQTGASLAGQAVPTEFSLAETKVALEYWIDSKLSRDTECAKRVCEHILDEFHEHLQGFKLRLSSTPIDLAPFHFQFQQSFVMAMETDPNKGYVRDLQNPRAIKEYKIIESCPAKDCDNLSPEVWEMLFTMKLSPL